MSKSESSENGGKIDRDIARLNEILARDIPALDFMINAMKGQFVDQQGERVPKLRSDAVERVVPALMSSVGASCWSVLKLTDPPDGWAVKDALAITRAIIEGCINISYILAAGNDVAKLAESHARQKSFRDLNREMSVAGIRMQLSYSGEANAESLKSLESDLKRYTSRKGKEIKSWTDQTIDQRLERVKKEFGDSPAGDLAVAYFAIYRHSSEILHGSYFGVLHFFGVTSPTLERGSPAIKNLVFLIYTQLIFCIGALIYCWARYYDEPNVLKARKRSIADLRELELVKAGWDDDSNGIEIVDDK